MKIGIIGAGITGLTIGLRLAQKGHQIVIWDSASEPGGLASGFKDDNWQWPLERHYHHLFTSDTAIQKLAEKLKIAINFYTPQTSIWYKNQSHPFDKPSDILKFKHLSLVTKLRLSASLAYLKYLPVWQQLENQTAKKWIISHMGRQAWQVLWEPLFIGKFGELADRISAAWFWARIHKRSRSLGYFEGGFQTLTNSLADRIRQLGGQILLGTSVSTIQPERATKVGIVANVNSGIYDRVVIAGPSHTITKLIKDIPRGYREKIDWLHGLGAVNLVLSLNQQFLTDNTYWLNINDRQMPFLAVVEHTNMINSQHYGGDHLIYIGNYLPANHEYFQHKEQQLIDIFFPHLQKINPNFSKDWIRKSWIFKAPFAQPIITTHYRELLPSMQTPFPHLWWVSMQHVYPWDRGTNYAVEWGEKMAKTVEESIG